MHTKRKGSIGEMAVAKYLMEHGFYVFKELGDLSRVDLIIEKDRKLQKIQVKALTSSNGSVDLKFTKSGPNYHFKYSELDVDWFIVFVLDTNDFIFIPSSEMEGKKTISIRLTKAKNNQLSNTNQLVNYSINRLLRDYTQNPQTDKAVGDDIVQTAKASPANES